MKPCPPLHHDHRGHQFGLRRVALLTGTGFFVTMLGQVTWIGSLPVRFLLKEKLHLDPLSMAGFFVAIGFAWYLKPLLGLVSDSVRLCGTRRRHYLLVGAATAAALWVTLGLVPTTFAWLIAIATALTAMVVLTNTVLGGLFVEAGQRFGATGQLSSLRIVIKNSAVILAGPLTGILAARPFGVTCTIGAVMFLCLPSGLKLSQQEQIARLLEGSPTDSTTSTRVSNAKIAKR